MYRYEMHLHTCGCSACGASTAREMVDAAKERGFAGIVFTNHFFRGNSCVDRNQPWKDFVAAYEKDWQDVREYAAQVDIDVLFGVEECYRAGREVLIYGVEPSVIAAEERFPTFTREELADFVRENGGFIAVAHPFRIKSYIPDPDVVEPSECFDAVEIYNAGNPADRNIKAWKYCKTSGLLPISGGDVHSGKNIGKAGLAFSERIRDSRALVEHLKDGDYKLIVNGEIVPIERCMEDFEQIVE